jgi:hypothetical protein
LFNPNLVYYIFYYILGVCCLCFQYVIRAPRAGKVEKILFKPGSTVSKGTALVHFASLEGEAKEAASAQS